MFRTLSFALAAIAALCLPTVSFAQGEKAVKSPLEFSLKSIDGKDAPLSAYKGKVVLLVNVASYCGNTPQYKGLQAMYEQHAQDGLVIVGIPANEFGKQEPGTDAEIKEFCDTNYKITFPMMSKIVVKGKGIDPLYKHLTSKETNGKFAGDITWNFEKFLIGRDGQVIARFNPRVNPESEDFKNAVKKALGI